EKGRLKVWGESTQGYFCYHIVALQDSLGAIFHLEKCFYQGMILKNLGELNVHTYKGGKISSKVVGATLNPKDQVLIFTRWEQQFFKTFLPSETDRMSLGNHKAQDWQLIKRRCDLVEILPFWRRLGLLVPKIKSVSLPGTASLIHTCHELIIHKKREKIARSLKNLFLAGFEGILSPRLNDHDYQGIVSTSEQSILSGNPFVLLSEGAEIIKSLFVQNNQNELFILPA